MEKNMQHTQNTFKLSQDGETLIFNGDEAICYDDYKSQNDPTETFFDWCKNSYSFIQEDKELKCTPGEWAIVSDGSGIVADKGTIASLHSVQNGNPLTVIMKEERIANAYMLAASKDMYHALKMCMKEMCKTQDEQGWPLSFREAYTFGLEALAKASPIH